MKAICITCKELKVVRYRECKPCREVTSREWREKYEAERAALQGPECAFLVRTPQGSKTHVFAYHKDLSILGCYSWSKQHNRTRICSKVMSIAEARKVSNCEHCHRD